MIWLECNNEEVRPLRLQVCLLACAMVKTTPLKSSKATLKQTIAELTKDKTIADKLIKKMKQTMIEMDHRHALELKQTMIECAWVCKAKDAAIACGRAAHNHIQQYMAISARWFVIASARSDSS
jgi:hypothetical protein